MTLRYFTKCLTLAILFVAFPFRLETDSLGHWVLVPPYAHAKNGSGSDGDGGDDGEGDDGGDDGEGDDDGDDGEGDDDDSSERDQSGKKKVWPVKVQKLTNGARVIYSDGSREEIVDGNFSHMNAVGRIVENRRARGSDLARMRAYFSRTPPRAEESAPVVKSRAVNATYRGQDVDILYANGWREQIKSGRFMLTDKYGRVVTSRRATQADRYRLNRFKR